MYIVAVLLRQSVALVSFILATNVSVIDVSMRCVGDCCCGIIYI